MSLHVDLKTGLLTPVTYVPSPNHDERPSNATINMVVIHGISLPPGKFGGSAVTQLFTNTLDMQADPFFATLSDVRVSSHLFINREGEIIQYVPFHRRAWHAGESLFQGMAQCNDFSIGIELEGTDAQPYEERQYFRLAEVVMLLKQAYPAITLERIVGHSDIAPERKTDPGVAFSWEYFRKLVIMRSL